MKTVVKEKLYDQVLALAASKKFKPIRPNLFWRWLMKTVGAKDLKETNFTYNKIGMEKLGPNEPCLILMNHSCFMDLEIAESIFYPKPLNVVCTSDGFVGKNWLLRQIGCIPTNKFVSDFLLVKNIKYSLETLKTNVLMYPEASYSFDGTATPLPSTVAKCLKLLNVPVIMIRTYGAYMRNPLYNNLQVRKVNVSADVKYLLSPQEIQEKSVDELNEILKQEFTFDNWKWQQENNIKITEPFRADCLNRVLYKCPVCQTEGEMEGTGEKLLCHHCNTEWTLTEDGYMRLETKGVELDQKFEHVPSWYEWEREQVRNEIKTGAYKIETNVDIYIMKNTDAIYKVGEGTLLHTKDGFVLDGCDGKLHYKQNPKSSYSLYSDYYWYEIGDMICIGDMKTLYYCFPKDGKDIVAKARIATEEIYKLMNA